MVKVKKQWPITFTKEGEQCFKCFSKEGWDFG